MRKMLPQKFGPVKYPITLEDLQPIMNMPETKRPPKPPKVLGLTPFAGDLEPKSTTRSGKALFGREQIALYHSSFKGLAFRPESPHNLGLGRHFA